MHVEIAGSGPRLVLVHGSVTPGWMTWNAQRPLASRFTLVLPIRSGYPPNPRLERIVCDVLEERLGAKRAVLPGSGHSIPRAPGFDEILTNLVESAERRRGRPTRFK